MDDPQRLLKEFKPSHDFYVGVDSDGCAFDTMELKQKECFVPNIVKHWNMQRVSKYLRETVEFVNLYSKWRGTNRFPALVKTFDLLSERPEAAARGLTMPDLAPLRKWIDTETRLGNPALEAAVAATGDPVLKRTLDWSLAVNETIADIVCDVPMFPKVRESLAALVDKADVIVVSATPGEALMREWIESGADELPQIIAGQEMGTKREQLELTAKDGYPEGHVLMIGDALGDLRAADSAGALFYPINPQGEEASWERFYGEAMDKFFAGEFAGDYQQALLDEFKSRLPETPPWKK